VCRRFALLLAPLLLLTLVSPAFAVDYRETAMAYLKTKYDVPENEIQLFEGGMMELELTGESFWCAKYIIGPVEPSITGGGDPGARPDGGQTKALPPGAEPAPIADPALDPDRGTSTLILPVPPEDVIQDDHVYGALYIRVKTGEVLEMDEAESYFVAERVLQEREWERLRLEAGKLDVSLYLKLKGVAASEKITVWIHPAAVVTETIRARFAAIKAKYPKIAEGLELADLLSYARAYIMPAVGRDVIVPEGSGGTAEPGVVEPGKTEPAPVPEDEYWREYSEFWQQIEELRAQAVAPSLAAIRSALEDNGIAYREEGTAVTADMTAGQIRAIAELPPVEAIYEYVIYTLMDGGVDQTGTPRGSTAAGDTKPPVATKDGAPESAGAAIPTSSGAYVAAVLLVGGLMAFGLRTIHARRK
jgi:hypothetical protein